MRPGKVASIRVNPKDCMGVVDVVEAAGLRVEGMSFPAMVSLALGSLLQTMRDQGIIPDRAGFEYNEIMAPFHGSRRSKRKLEITDTIHKAGSGIKLQGLSKPAGDFSALTEPREVGPTVQPEPARKEVDAEPVPAEVRRARTRLTELLQKKDLAEEQGSGVVWSAGDEEEFQQVYKMVYPEG